MNPQAALDPAAFNWGTRFSSGLQAGQQARKESQLTQLMGDAFTSGNYDGEGGLSALLAEQGDVGGALKMREYAGQQAAQQQQQLKQEELEAASIVYQIASEFDTPQERYDAVMRAGAFFADKGYNIIDGGMSPDQFTNENMQLGATLLRANDMLNEPNQAEKPSYQTFDADGDGVNDKVAVYPDGRREVLGSIARAPKADYGTVVDPTTGLVYTGNNASQAFRSDMGQVAASEDEAGKAQEIMDIYDDLYGLIEDGVNTGLFASARAFGSRLMAEMDIEGEVLGVSAEDASKFERMFAGSQELGARTLEFFGGSDTERELEIALQTNPGLDKTPETNKELLDRKMRAAEILIQKPDFQREWINTYGSTMRPNERGEFFGQVWRQYQRDVFGRSNTVTNAQTGEEIPVESRAPDFSSASDDELFGVLTGR